MFTPDDLPEVTERTDRHDNVYIHAGDWSFDPTEDNSPAYAWDAAKAWAAYALHLEAK